MDSRPSDETLLPAVAERNLGAFRSTERDHDAHRALDVSPARRLPDGMSRRWGA